jgi:hypothetical protein
MSDILFEGLEPSDLKRMVTPILHVDRYKAKLGSDDDICVLSIAVKGNEAAKDLSNFIEKGYEWVIDADVSSGEISDGKYLVFVEMERRRDIPQQIMTMLDEMENVTELKPKDWILRYGKDNKNYKLNIASLSKKIPLSPHDYRMLKDQLDKMKHAAGLNIKSDDSTKHNDVETLKWLSGLK